MELTPKRISRVALLVASFRAGGVERVTINLANELARRGYQVDLVVLSAAGGALRSGVGQTVTVFDLRSSRSLYGVRALANYFKQHQPDIFISNQTHLNILSIFASWRAKSRALLYVVEHNHMTSVVRNSKKLADRLRPLLARLFYPYAHKVLAVSQDAADDLAALAGFQNEEIFVVYNSILPGDFSSQAELPAEDPWFKEIQEPFVIAVGRLAPQKAFDTLIRAMDKVNQSRPVQLLILGEGGERANLEALVEQLALQEIVSLPGYVDNPLRYVARANLFVLSSLWEGLPSVLIEAMACGTSVVSTNCPAGPREILHNGFYGKLVPVGDATEMAQAILEVLADPQDARQLKERAKQYIAPYAAESYIQLFESEGVND
ncbi:MAG: glycosyltransferase [Anaerolineales bacterium]|nr:glycosyltransferase [Anaerolineales bacterium]